jgi:hypothetical protein
MQLTRSKDGVRGRAALAVGSLKGPRTWGAKSFIVADNNREPGLDELGKHR